MDLALGIFVIVIAGAESSIGLELVVGYHKNHDQISLDLKETNLCYYLYILYHIILVL
jgi:NADH:ubiquinone oxidoreductase subunit K